jgi:hypothetical protein
VCNCLFISHQITARCPVKNRDERSLKNIGRSGPCGSIRFAAIAVSARLFVRGTYSTEDFP